MATSFLQKLKLGFRGWSRRRAEEAARRDAQFLERATPWAKPSPAPPSVQTASAPRAPFDLEGLQVAYLENSGKIAHYLDLDSGDVVDTPASETSYDASPQRYRRVPQRSADSDQRDRIDFIRTIEKPEIRQALETAVNAPDEFRKALALDHAVERAWYSFKNRRAAEAIDLWLTTLGSRPAV